MRERPWLFRSRLRKWFVIAAAFFVVVVVLPAFALAPVAPEGTPLFLRNWAYDARLAIGRPITTFSSLAQVITQDPEMLLAQGGERVAFESAGLRLVGTLYGADDGAEEPAVLLLHGSTPQGRKLGMYRLLAQRLAERGYVVLTLDQRGYGESDNPPQVDNAASFDFVEDVDNALAFLHEVDGVDAERLYLVGHSFGGDVAVSAVAEGTAVSKLVLIGPGRRFIERGGVVTAPEFEYFKRREMRYMWLTQPIPTDVFLEYRATLPLENHLDYLQTSEHVPVLFIDGALEGEADQTFLADVYNSAKGEKAYFTLQDADHYANVANLGPLVFYDEAAVEQLLDEIDTFFSAADNTTRN